MVDADEPASEGEQEEEGLISDADLDAMLCPVCSKSDEDGFVLCDTCDEGGGHFGCLGLEAVPEGDWFCKTCVEAGKDKEKAAEDAKLAATTKAKPKPQPKTKKASRAAVSDAEEEDEDGGDDSGDDDADFAPSDDDDEPEKPSRRSSRGGVAKSTPKKSHAKRKRGGAKAAKASTSDDEGADKVEDEEEDAEEKEEGSGGAAAVLDEAALLEAAAATAAEAKTRLAQVTDVDELRTECERLLDENAELRAKLEAAEGRAASKAPPKRSGGGNRSRAAPKRGKAAAAAAAPSDDAEEEDEDAEEPAAKKAKGKGAAASAKGKAPAAAGAKSAQAAEKEAEKARKSVIKQLNSQMIYKQGSGGGRLSAEYPNMSKEAWALISKGRGASFELKSADNVEEDSEEYVATFPGTMGQRVCKSLRYGAVLRPVYPVRRRMLSESHSLLSLVL